MGREVAFVRPKTISDFTSRKTWGGSLEVAGLEVY